MKSHAITAIAIAVGAGIWAHTGFGESTDKASPETAEPEITLSSDLKVDPDKKAEATEPLTEAENPTTADAVVTESEDKAAAEATAPTGEEIAAEGKEATSDSVDIPNPPVVRGLDSEEEKGPEAAETKTEGGFKAEKSETAKAGNVCELCGKSREGRILICPSGTCVFPGEVTIYRVPVPAPYFYVPDYGYDYVPCPPPVCHW